MNETEIRPGDNIPFAYFREAGVLGFFAEDFSCRVDEIGEYYLYDQQNTVPGNTTLQRDTDSWVLIGTWRTITATVLHARPV